MPSANKSPSSGYGWFVVSIAAMFYCYEYFLRIAPSVMVDELRGHYGLDAALFGHLSAFYYYAYTPMQLPVGLLVDRYGTRHLLTIACLCCAIGAFTFGYFDSLILAKLTRFIIGFGSAFAFVGVLSLANTWLSGRIIGLIAGLTTSLGMIGAVQGELWLAKITLAVGWQQTMIYAGYLGLVLTAIIWLFVRDDETQEREAIQWQDFFLKVLKIFTKRTVLTAAAIGAILYLSLSVFAELWAVPFLQVAYDMDKLAAAKTITLVYLGWAIGGPLLGFYSDKLENRHTPLVYGALGALACIATIIFIPNLPHLLLYSLLFAYGVFCGGEVIIFAIAKESVKDSMAASAIAVVNMLVMFLGMILQPLVGKILDIVWSGEFDSAIRVYSQANYQWALASIPIGLVIAFVLAYRLRA